MYKFMDEITDFTFGVWLLFAGLSEHAMSGVISFAVLTAMMFLTVCLSVATGGRAKNGKMSAAFNLFFLFYVLFLAYIYWQLHATNYVLDHSAAEKMYGTVIMNGAFYYIAYLYFARKDSFERAMNIYLAASYVLLLVIVMRSGGDILGGRLGNTSGVNSNMLALNLMNCVLILLDKNARHKDTKNIVLIGISLFFILLTGSRKGLMGVAIGLLLFAALSEGRQKYGKLLIVGAAVIILVWSVLNIKPLYDIAGHRLESVLSYLNNESFDEGSLESRSSYIELGMEYVRRRPLWGYGLDCFRVIKGAYGTYSHNNYVELLFGVGIIGIIPYYLCYVYVLINDVILLKKGYKQMRLWLVLLVVQTALEYAFISYFVRTTMIMVILNLSMIFSIRRNMK